MTSAFLFTKILGTHLVGRGLTIFLFLLYLLFLCLLPLIPAGVGSRLALMTGPEAEATRSLIVPCYVVAQASPVVQAVVTVEGAPPNWVLQGMTRGAPQASGSC